MIGIDQAVIRKLIINRVGSSEHSATISSGLTGYENEDEEAVLKKIFLKPFSNQFETFEFNHEIDMDYNVLFNLSKAIFEEEDFVEKAQEITLHLQSTSKHPNIKEGDLFIVKFDDILLNKQYYRGLGIYKFEDKDNFIETSPNEKGLGIKFQKGIGQPKAR